MLNIVQMHSSCNLNKQWRWKIKAQICLFVSNNYLTTDADTRIQLQIMSSHYSVASSDVCEIKAKNNFYNRNKLFSKGNLLYLHLGVQQFSNELDCISIVRSIKQLKSIMKVLLTENQLALLKYDKSSSIDFEKELEPANKTYHKLNTAGKPLKPWKYNLKIWDFELTFLHFNN